MRIVIDTNVWVSALVYGGVPRKVFEASISQGFIIIVSAELLSEIRRILHDKFPDFTSDFEDLLRVITPRLAKTVLGSITVNVSRDPKDNYVLETAIIGNANIIISGDTDLLSLNQFQGIDINSPKQFLEAL